MGKTEKQTQFDRKTVEAAVDAYVSAKIGSVGIAVFKSRDPGVVAIEQLDRIDSAKVDWDEFAAEIEKETGLKVLCVANCDWQVEGDADEEATLIAFDTPETDPEYRDYYKNMLTPESPAPGL